MLNTNDPKSKSVPRYYLYALLVICIIMNAIFVSIGFNKSILDGHDFRQTQTAISTYYTLKNGYYLAYETPVFGYPWSIPFEFPLYQWTVAFLSEISGIQLEQSGRLVSIAFFYLSLVTVFYILRSFAIEYEYCCVPVILLLCCPTYIFWSRTFMIESLSIFLSLTYLLYFIKYYMNPNRYLFILALLFGGLAAAVKITTFIVASVPILVLLLYASLSHLHKLFRKRSRDCCPGFLHSQFNHSILLVIPYVIGLAWTGFSDYHKSLNPLARDFITSTHLVEWNFGTWSQRFSPTYWKTFLTYDVSYGIGYPIILIVPFLVVLTTYRYISIVILSLLAYISGPIFLTNLYYMHRYYCYANTVFLIIATAVSIISLIKVERFKRFALYGLIPVCLVTMVYAYLNGHYRIQNESDEASETPLVCLLIKAVTDPEDVLLIYQEDWNPTIAYYSERRSIMNRWNYALSDTRFQECIKGTGKKRISVLLKEFRDDQLNEYFFFHPDPVMNCVYLREDVYQRAFMKLFHVDVGQCFSVRPLKISYFKGQFRLFSATGSTLAVPLSTSVSKLKAQFGVLFDAKEVKISAGVDFVITHEGRDGVRTELFRTHLDPARSKTHREACGTELSVGNLAAGKLLLETVPGPGKSCEWCYWSDIELN